MDRQDLRSRVTAQFDSFKEESEEIHPHRGRLRANVVWSCDARIPGDAESVNLTVPVRKWQGLHWTESRGRARGGGLRGARERDGTTE